MDKITYQIHIVRGDTVLFEWEYVTPFVTIHKGESIKMPGWAASAIVESVSHEFEENPHVGDGTHLIQRTIVKCV